MSSSGSTPRVMRGAWAVACAAVVLACLGPRADAQTTVTENIVVAVTPANETIYTAFGYEAFPTVTEAVTAAISRAQTAYQHYTVLVDQFSSPWSESLSVPADADITIRGSSGPGTLGTPEEAVIQSTDFNLPALEVVPPATGSTRRTDRLIVEALTLTSGSNGAQVRSGQPTFNRVYFYQNAGSGIVTQEDGTSVLLVNCSIAENGWDGLSVEANSFADVLYCSIIDNALAGAQVYSAGGGNAQIRNTIVFQNGEAGLRWDAAPTTPPVLVKNDVYLNPDPANDQNYVNIVDPADFIAVDPEFDETASWVGKLDAADAAYAGYTVIDKASSIYLLPYSGEDFEGQIRPYFQIDATTPFDIGADEVSVDPLGIPSWYTCIVRVNDVVQHIIPAAEAGAVEIEIRVFGTDDQPEVFVVPEGGSFTDSATWIEFDVTTHAGYGIWYAENVDPITTILADTGTVANEPDAGDILADGNGYVILRYGSDILGDNDSSDLIFDQAEIGRHVIVDTIPPRMYITVAPPAGLSAADLVELLNNQFSYTAGATSGMQPPGLPGFPGTFLPATVAAPYDNGLINAGDIDGFGASMFFNVMSFTNQEGGTLLRNEVPPNLNIRVTVDFEDPPVEDANGVDLTTSVSGFPLEPDTLVLTQGLDRAPAPAQWVMGFTENALLAGITANLAYTPSGANQAWDLETGDLADLDNNLLQAVWTFEEDGGVAGISAARAINNGYTMELTPRFRGVDRAGNVTPADQLLEPLRLVWNLGANSVITPNRDGQEVAFPNFTIAMDPKWPSSTDDPVEPLLSYRLYSSATIDGPYTPIGGWQNWVAAGSASITNPPQNTWILMVTIGADSAGNVEAWPGLAAGIDPEAPDFRTTPFQASSNWHRFRIGGGDLDTTIEPSIWHNNLGTYDTVYNSANDPQSFGAQTIIPTPINLAAAQVEATFNFVAEAQDLTNVGILWRISLDGDPGPPTNIAPGAVDPAGRASVTLPGTAQAVNSPNRLEDAVAPRVARNWVVQAWAFLDVNGDGSWNAGELYDPTPATFAFTVVPENSIQQYVKNRASGDRQPVKIQQEQ